MRGGKTKNKNKRNKKKQKKNKRKTKDHGRHGKLLDTNIWIVYWRSIGGL